MHIMKYTFKLQGYLFIGYKPFDILKNLEISRLFFFQSSNTPRILSNSIESNPNPYWSCRLGGRLTSAEGLTLIHRKINMSYQSMRGCLASNRFFQGFTVYPLRQTSYNSWIITASNAITAIDNSHAYLWRLLIYTKYWVSYQPHESFSARTVSSWNIFVTNLSREWQNGPRLARVICQMCASKKIGTRAQQLFSYKRSRNRHVTSCVQQTTEVSINIYIMIKMLYSHERGLRFFEITALLMSLISVVCRNIISAVHRTVRTHVWMYCIMYFFLSSLLAAIQIN